MKIIVLLVLFSYVLFPNDTLQINSLKNNDTIVKKNETKKVIIENEISYFERYQTLFGTIIGSALAALIAILSIWKTHKNQLFIENEKIKVERYQEEKVYCGYLYSIWSLLIGHQAFLTSLKRELDSIVDDSKIRGKIAYDKPFNALPVDLLKESFFHVLAYEKYNSKIVDKLVSYLSVMDSLTNELNFIPIKKLKEEISDPKEYGQRIDFYFSQVFGHLDILLEIAKKTEEEILEELVKSKTSNVFVQGAKDIKDKIDLKENKTT